LHQLETDISSAAQQQASSGVPEAKQGSAVVMIGRADEELNVGSGNMDSRGTALFTVRRRASQHQDRATMFVTASGLTSMLERLDKYEAWTEVSPRRPQQFWMFESLASIQTARLEDFWNDVFSNFPQGRSRTEWEVWTRHSLEQPFLHALSSLDLEVQGGVTRFVDTNVRNVVASPRQLMRLINSSAAVVELRGASSFVAKSEKDANAQRFREGTFAKRIVPAKESAPLVTLLDTGVNRENPFLTASLPESRCYSADRAWDRFDSDGHGTKMAGIALFGDLDDALAGQDAILPAIALESVAISAPESAARLPARDALQRAVQIVEQKSLRRRVFCLAATARGEAEDGRPTSTSSALDKLAFNDGENTRLFCSAVGNVFMSPFEPYQVSQYSGHNEDHGVQSPAQALNALSVGAATHRCSVEGLLAPPGGLSPTSRTAQAWEIAHPHKPDIVMEGGNHIIDPSGETSRPHAADMIRTTSRDVTRPLTRTGETSAATAAASRFAALTAAHYPQLRAETIRGLMVHSARWTDEMVAYQETLVAAGYSAQEAWEKILACYGWGIPDLERLIWSADNALTLVVEDTLRPYRTADKGNSIRLREMKYFRLPWPDGTLAAMGNTEVEMRCTLSYFIEPDPSSVSRDRFERYPSHRLKFDFKRFGESDEQAQSRTNLAVEGDGAAGDDRGWLLGARLKPRGTLHQDVWRGPAYMLENRNGVSVVPVRGWWGDRPSIKPQDAVVNFSLIVSITTPSLENNIYAEAEARVPVSARVARVAAARR
jgi:hypothetical protein